MEIRNKSSAADTIHSFRSRPGWRRPAYFPTVVVLAAAWLIVVGFILLVASAMGISHAEEAHFALGISLTMALAFIAYLSIFTQRFVTENTSQYIFELAESEARLKVSSTKPKHGLLLRMPYTEVNFVEYFTPRDNAALVFHGKGGRIMEVPLWSMTEDSSAILQFLQSKGLPIETT